MKTAVASLLVVLLCLTKLPAVHGQTYSVLHSFDGYPGDGAKPYAGLTISGSTLYGTTEGGGSNGSGTIFKIDTTGSGYSQLLSFDWFYLNQGMSPESSLTLNGGTLYGTTVGGGNKGLVYCIGTDGSGYSNLFGFLGGDGQFPVGGVTVDGSTLYGTASGGGWAYDAGTVFRLGTDGNGFSVLQYFASSGFTGRSPSANLTLADSTLYGTAHQGGNFSGSIYGWGTVFKINTDGTGATDLHVFTGGSDGGNPFSSLLLSGTTLYGTAHNGGIKDSNNTQGYGTIFKMNPDGTGFTVLHSFDSSDAANPYSGLILEGSTLYGTTENGGSSNKGTIFEIGTDGSGYRILHSFSGMDGANPYGDLIFDGGTLYGTTCNGGNGYGVVFSLTVPEPSVLVLFGAGAVSLLAYLWRKRQ